jgi:GTPase SAR1 family protein
MGDCRVSRMSYTAHSAHNSVNLVMWALSFTGSYVLPERALCCCSLRHHPDRAHSLLSFRLFRLTVSQQASLEKARSWVRELQRQADPSIIIALCGNKTDLAARRQVTQEEAQKYAEEEGLMWMEASAKTGEGVQDVFMAIGMYTF